MGTYEIALLLHILGVIVMLGGILTAGLAFYVARGRPTPAEVAAVLQLSRIGVVAGGIGFALTVGGGLWLVHAAGLSYTEHWLLSAYVLLVVSSVLGGLGGRGPKQARLHAAELAVRGEGIDERLRGLLFDRRSEVVNRLADVTMLAVLVLMVWRPGD